ncbi:MAG: hypothetical protein QOI73_1436 [Solirubrobacteraceae bacterium]|nr:hypothetical protein [Solirubrobacteraceae bacterium]
MKRTAAAVAAAAVSLLVSACGGRERARAADAGQIVPAASSLSVPGVGKAKRIEAFGHSYVGAYGVGEERGFYTLVARHFGIARAGQTGGGGSGVIDQLGDVYSQSLQRRSGPGVQLALVMWGINDLARYGPEGLPAVQNGLTSLISRIRVAPGDAHGFADRSVRLHGSWQTRGAVTTTTAAAAIEINVPRRTRGRVLAFVAPASRRTGALYRFTVDGHRAGRLDTRGLSPAKPANAGDAGTPLIKRLRLPARARTVRVEVTNVNRRAEFLGWHAEAKRAPLVAVVHQPPLPDYGAFDRSEHRVGDSDVAALNGAIDAAASAFSDDRVVVADAEDPLGGDDAFYLDDRLHPNAVGHEWLARRTIEALERAAARLHRQARG